MSTTPPPRTLLGLLSPAGRRDIWSYGKQLSDKAQSLFSPKLPSSPMFEEHATGALASPRPQGGLSDVVLASIHAQHEINEHHSQDQRTNRALMLASALAHRRTEMLVKEGMHRLARLQRTVASQEITIGSLTDSVSELRIEATVQKDATSRLRRALHENTQLLRDSIARYQEDKHAQDALIARQQLVLEKLQQRRVSRDLVVDGVLLLACLAAVNVSLVDVPIRLVLRLLDSSLSFALPARRQRLQAFVRQLLKLLLLVQMYIRSRRLAVSVGLHTSMGDASSYSYQLLRLFRLLSLHMQRSVASRTVHPVPTPEPRTPLRPAVAAEHSFLGSPMLASIATPSQWSKD